MYKVSFSNELLILEPGALAVMSAAMARVMLSPLLYMLVITVNLEKYAADVWVLPASPEDPTSPVLSPEHIKTPWP
jgi:hypothetical protein